MNGKLKNGCIFLLCVLSLLKLLVTGCATYKGNPPLADVSGFSKAEPSISLEKPLYVTFDFRHYANGAPAAGQFAGRVQYFKNGLLKTLREMNPMAVKEGFPSEELCYRLQVSLKEEERFSQAGVFFCGFTLFLLPGFNKIVYELKAELFDEKNKLISSYSFENSFHIVMELFLIFYMPFNTNYAGIVSENLFKQLAIGVEKDLRKGLR